MNAPTILELPPPAYADYVLDAKLRWRAQGLRTALLTVVAIDGSSPRPLGSQMAVAENGQSIGAISGGCAEPAIVRDALVAISLGLNHLERYGKGSRFKDISLPCGSGIDVYFDVTLADGHLESLVTAHAGRHSVSYVCEAPHGLFVKAYEPTRRLIIIGRGHIVPALAQVSKLSEFETIVYTPDRETRDLCSAFAEVNPLSASSDLNSHVLDASTALVSLFHEHDYEPDILDQALSSELFYIGALGSRQTHANRLDHLRGRGWRDGDLSRIHGPVGLDITAKSPPEIAVAIMAQVIQESHARTARQVTSQPVAIP